LIWDDALKAGEMTFFAEQVPMKGPSIDFCCGYGFWTSRIIGKIDIGVDLFPDEGSYMRSIQGFIEKNFIQGAYRSVLKADVAEALPLPDNFFNSIVSICSLEHIDRVENVLQTMARIVKPGGFAYLSLQTNRYIEVFEKIFNPEYVRWVRETFALHWDRSWQTWEDLIQQAGLIIEKRRFLLSEKATALKALSYWENPFAPLLGELNLEQAVKQIPQFRNHYYKLVRQWSIQQVDPDEASIVCFVCRSNQ
jgi:SAM-dependent methyltransferase